MITGLIKHQRALIFSGLAFFVLVIVLAVISLFDNQQILGVNRWIKPMKFAVSITIYLWTLAIYLTFVNKQRRAVKIISYGTITMMTGEIILILMQAIRGTTSHFNIATPFDGIVFSMMGLMIGVNTILAIYLLFLYLKSNINLPKSIIWGMRLGIILVLLASFEGGFMSGLSKHSVGVMDGGEGLPLINWSTKGGDLRIAHFVGLHAFQIVPFFALILEKLRVNNSTYLTFGFAFAYFTLFSFVFIQALFAKPLLSLF